MSVHVCVCVCVCVYVCVCVCVCVGVVVVFVLPFFFLGGGFFFCIYANVLACQNCFVLISLMWFYSLLCKLQAFMLKTLCMFDVITKRLTIFPRLEITVPVGWALNTNN